MRKVIRGILVLLFLIPVYSLAASIEGVILPKAVSIKGNDIPLNGAGIRTKFFFDIYVGALYLPFPTHSAANAIEQAGPKRIVMHFLYKKVSRKRLVSGFNKGFEKNQNPEKLGKLQTRLRQFSALFSGVRRGDEVILDLSAKGQTNVFLNGTQLGSIEGRDFQQALLAVWLGHAPADSDLKEAMLGMN